VVRLVDAATRTATATLETGAPSALAFSPDGATLASTGKGITAQLWDTITGNKGLVLQGPDRFAEDLAFAPDGSVLGTAGGHEGSVRLWSVASGDEIAVLRAAGGLHRIVFGADGMLVFGGSLDLHVHYFDAAFRNVLTTTVLRYDGRAQALALSPDGSVIAVGGDSGLRFWRSRGVDRANRPLWSESTQLRGHSKGILSLVFSGDGQWVASASADDTVRVWAIDSATELISLHVARARKMEFFGQHVRSVAFTPDGTLITGDAEGILGFWRVTTDLLRCK
jgi:WD40 repeat protein